MNVSAKKDSCGTKKKENVSLELVSLPLSSITKISVSVLKPINTKTITVFVLKELLKTMKHVYNVFLKIVNFVYQKQNV